MQFHNKSEKYLYRMMKGACPRTWGRRCMQEPHHQAAAMQMEESHLLINHSISTRCRKKSHKATRINLKTPQRRTTRQRLTTWSHQLLCNRHLTWRLLNYKKKLVQMTGIPQSSTKTSTGRPTTPQFLSVAPINLQIAINSSRMRARANTLRIFWVHSRCHSPNRVRGQITSTSYWRWSGSSSSSPTMPRNSCLILQNNTRLSDSLNKTDYSTTKWIWQMKNKTTIL